MSIRGLSNLIVTIMAAGEVVALPADDQRLLHAALVELADDAGDAAERVWRRHGGRPDTLADPGVMRAVPGVRPALWEAVGANLVTAHENSDGSGDYRLTPTQRANASRTLLRLPADEVAVLHRVGASWALRSTSRKNAAKGPGSPAATRRVKLA